MKHRVIVGVPELDIFWVAALFPEFNLWFADVCSNDLLEMTRENFGGLTRAAANVQAKGEEIFGDTL